MKIKALTLLALILTLAAPALAQTPTPDTITFEAISGKTPIPYNLGDSVPAAARLASLTLPGGAIVRFATRAGAKYVALVTQFGTTAIAGVTRKGKLDVARSLDIRIRKSKGARFESFVPIQAGKRIVDNKGNTDPKDDLLAYDNPGSATFQLYDERSKLYPANGAALQLVRSISTALVLVREPYDLTTTGLNFTRILIGGDVVYDDFVVSYGN